MTEHMSTDVQYKDDLRKQRDNWKDVIEELEASPNLRTDENIRNAHKLAKRELNRILESLQD